MDLDVEKLEEFVSKYPNFDELSHVKKFEVLGCYLTEISKDCCAITASDILDIYDKLAMQKPKKPANILVDGLLNGRFVMTKGVGFRLERKAKNEIMQTLNSSPQLVAVNKALAALPQKITDPMEQQFLKEVLACCSVAAFRAAVTMCWSLAVYHLQRYIIAHKLTEFNAALPRVVQNGRIKAVKTIDDFSELKESQFIEICRAANIVSNDVRKILEEKLDFRNTCAHPSNVVVHETKATAAIQDLIDNLVLKYN